MESTRDEFDLVSVQNLKTLALRTRLIKQRPSFA
jgi:hypothetical protein